MTVSRRLLLGVASFAAEGAWTLAALALLSQWATDGRFPVWPVWTFYPAAAIAYIVLKRWRPRPRLALALRVVLFCGGLALMVVYVGRQTGDFYIAVWALMAATALGWRGWVLASDSMTFGPILHRFQTGVAAVIAVVAVASITDVSFPYAVPLVAGFFLVSFFALSLARTELGPGASGLAWLGVSGLLMVLVFIVGLAVAAVTTPSTVEAILAPLRAAWSGVIAASEALAELLPARDPNDPVPTLEPFPTPEILEPREISPLTVTIISYIGVALMVVVTIMFVVALLRFLRRWFAERASDGVDLERLDIGLRLDWRSLFRALRNLALRPFRWLADRMRPQPGPAPLEVSYRRLQRWGRRRGVPRAAHQTPLEYLEALTDVWPVQRAAFEHITHAYVAGAYSPRGPDADALREAERHWRALRRVGGVWSFARKGRAPIAAVGEKLED